VVRMKTCVSNRVTDGPAKTKIVTYRRYAIYLYVSSTTTRRVHEKIARIRTSSKWSGCHSRIERPRQQPQEKKSVGISCIVHALLELAIRLLLQAGEDRAVAIAACGGGQPSAKRQAPSANKRRVKSKKGRGRGRGRGPPGARRGGGGLPSPTAYSKEPRSRGRGTQPR
jgi:hypothetical protein